MVIQKLLDRNDDAKKIGNVGNLDFSKKNNLDKNIEFCQQIKLYCLSKTKFYVLAVLVRLPAKLVFLIPTKSTKIEFKGGSKKNWGYFWGYFLK